MPVIHCFGAFFGMTASSLSVSILMARSSSVTLAHVDSFVVCASAVKAPKTLMAKLNDI